MPILDGYQATQKIMKMVLKEKVDCTIVALTSYTGKGVDEKCFSLGMKEVLRKPVYAKDLRRVVNKYYYER